MLCLKSSIGLCRKVNWYSMTTAAHAELDQTDCTEGTLNNILFIGKWRRLCGRGWFIRELLGDCSHHWAARICFFLSDTDCILYLLQSVFYPLRICMSFLYNSSDWGMDPSRHQHSGLAGYVRHDAIAHIFPVTWLTCSTLVPHFNMLSF